MKKLLEPTGPDYLRRLVKMINDMTRAGKTVEGEDVARPGVRRKVVHLMIKQGMIWAHDEKTWVAHPEKFTDATGDTIVASRETR